MRRTGSWSAVSSLRIPPQWFNTGLSWAYGIGEPVGHWYVDSDDCVKEISVSHERSQPHACFIQSVSDDLVSDGGIMDPFLREARLFKYGSGTDRTSAICVARTSLFLEVVARRAS